MKHKVRTIPLRSWKGFETIAVYGSSHASISKRADVTFVRGEDDLDDTWEVAVRLPSGRKVALVEHINSPQVGTSIMFAGARAAAPEVIVETLQALHLDPRRLTWTVVPVTRRQARRSSSSGAPVATPDALSPWVLRSRSGRVRAALRNATSKRLHAIADRIAEPEVA